MFPLSLDDISLLLTFTAIIMLVVAQLLFPLHNLDFILNKKRFKNIAHIMGFLSIFTLCFRVYMLLITMT